MKKVIPVAILILFFSPGSIFSNGSENFDQRTRPKTTCNKENDPVKDAKRVMAAINSSGIGFLDKWMAKYNGVCVTFYSFDPGKWYSVNYYTGPESRIMCGTGGSFFLTEFGIADLYRQGIILYFIDEMQNGMIRIHGASATESPIELKLFPKSEIKEVFKGENPFEVGENFYQILTRLDILDASHNKEQGSCMFTLKDRSLLFYYPNGYDPLKVKPVVTEDKGIWIADNWFLYLSK